jgi:hypothetical protein
MAPQAVAEQAAAFAAAQGWIEHRMRNLLLLSGERRP